MLTGQFQRIQTLIAAMRGLDTLKIFAYFAYYVLHAFSLFTTTYGIAVVLDVEDSFFGWIVPSAISLAVQTMIGVSGHLFRRAFRRRRWDIFVASAAMLTICVSISVGFAYAFWWHHLRSDRVAREVAAAETDRVIRPVQAFSHHLSVVSDSLDHLAMYSAERADVERKTGGTCEEVGQGAGPRTRLREADKRRFEALARGFANTAGEAQQALGELHDRRETYDPARHDDHAAAVNRILQRVRPLVRTNYEPTIDQLGERVERGRGEMEDDLTGERYRCRDSHLEDFVRQAIGPLERLQNIRQDVPTELVLHRPDRLSSLAVAYRQLGTLLGVSNGADNESLSREAADATPLLLALTVDAVIFLLPFAFHERSSGADGGDDGGNGRDFIGEINAAVDPDSPAPGTAAYRLLNFAYEDGERRNLYDLFDRFLIEGRRRDEIVLPFDRETPESRALRRVLQALGWRPHFPRLRVTSWLRQRLRSCQDLNDVSVVALYRIEPGLMRDLVRASVCQSSPSRSDVPSTSGRASSVVRLDAVERGSRT